MQILQGRCVDHLEILELRKPNSELDNGFPKVWGLGKKDDSCLGLIGKYLSSLSSETEVFFFKGLDRILDVCCPR